MDIQTWYGTGIRVPTSRDRHNYPSFLANTVGLVRMMVQRKLDREVSVRFDSCQTASMNQEKNQINISTSFYEGWFGGFNGKQEDVPTTITSILGVIIHELAHLAWSPKTLKPWADYIQSNSDLPFNAELAMSVGNLVEDVYIETRIQREMYSLYWMVEKTSWVMWPEEERSNRIELAMGINDHPQSQEEVSILYNMGLLVKVADYSISPFVDGFLSLVALARDEQTVDDRLHLGQQVYEFLVKNLPESEASKSPSPSMNLGDITVDHSTEGKAGMPSASINATYNDLNSKLEKGESQILNIDNDDSTSVLYNEVPVVNGIKPPVNLDVNQKYSQLGQLARQMTAVNRPYGQQRNRGHNVRNLYRIVTDQRIFADPMRVQHPRPLEVAILVDCSGSMRWGLKDTSIGVSIQDSRIYRALSACVGAAESLANFHAMVSVWGHTADVYEEYTTTIFRFKTWNESLAVLKQRAEVMVANHGVGDFRVSGNRDGDAVGYVGKKFSPSGTRKMLIVISDGLPAAKDYGSEQGEQHTKRKVDALRSRGVHVQSISITPAAQEANNRIYGKEFNVNDHDPNVIHSIVQSLILTEVSR